MKNKIIFGIMSVAILAFTLLLATFSVDSPNASPMNFFAVLAGGLLIITILGIFLFSKNKKVTKITKYILIVVACLVGALVIFEFVINIYFRVSPDAYVNSITEYDANENVVSDIGTTTTSLVSTTTEKLSELPKKFCDAISNNTIIENSTRYNPDTRPKNVSSGFCKIYIGSGVTDIFSFENMSTSTDPSFVLNIYNSKKALLQSIKLDYDWFFSDVTINLHDDINFDGYKDLLLQVFGPRATEFTYYMYNPLKTIFVPNDTLSYIFTPTFNSQKKEISVTPDTPNYYTDANGNQQYYTPEQQTTIIKFKNGEYLDIQDGVPVFQ